jgi:UDP-glucose 4-epimerase
MKKNILITGSQGFLARHAAMKLKKHFNVYGIGRGKWKKKEHFNWGYIENINDNISIGSFSGYKIKFEYIIHCAGKVIGLEPEEDFKRNVLTTQSLLDYVSTSKFNSKIIFLSTLAVYGNIKKKLKNSQKIDPISNYALNKILAEDLCKFYSKKYGISILSLRTGSLFGPGLERQFIFDACKKINENKRIFFGTGNEVRDWLYIDDMTDLLVKIVNKGFKSYTIMNVGSGKGVKIKKIITHINKRLNKNIKPIFNGIGRNANPKILVSDNTLVKKFNWKPRSDFFESLDIYIDWYKGKYAKTGIFN